MNFAAHHVQVNVIERTSAGKHLGHATHRQYDLCVVRPLRVVGPSWSWLRVFRR
jgi:hypothetical protein